MKKLVSVLIALLLVGSFAFAEVSVGNWNRILFAPMANVDADDLDQDAFAFMGPDWGGRGRVGLGFGGSGDNTGFALDIHSNGTNLGVGDQAKGWIKINDKIKVQFGKIQQDTLRGKIGDSGFLGAIAGATVGEAPATASVALAQGATGEDAIFQRFYPTAGMMLDLTPAEGVYIGAALDTNNGGPTLSEQMFNEIQIGAGYVLPELGHLRAQYIGGYDTDAADAPKYLNVAFAYTAMEGLLVDAGLKYQMTADVGKSTVAASAKYSADALSAVARFVLGFGEADGNDDTLLQGSADVGYAVADPLNVGIEVSFKKEGDPTNVTVAPYAKLGYAGGFLKAGFAYSSFADATVTVAGTDYVTDYTAWSLPIMMEFGF